MPKSSSRREKIETAKSVVAAAICVWLISLLLEGWVDRMVGLSISGRPGLAGFLGVFAPSVAWGTGLRLLSRWDLSLDDLYKLQGGWWRCAFIVIIAPILTVGAFLYCRQRTQNAGDRRGG